MPHPFSTHITVMETSLVFDVLSFILHDLFHIYAFYEKVLPAMLLFPLKSLYRV